LKELSAFRNGGVALITADHEIRTDIDYETGGVYCQHYTVDPMIAVGLGRSKTDRRRLSDLTPTIHDIMGVKKPEEIQAAQLLKKVK
jgi:bisphosphoglycerate-independent phosphoglycerate mutase (AlkP superfamily)